MRKLVLLWLVVMALVVASDALAEIRLGGNRDAGRGSLGTMRDNPYSSESLSNPFGAGSPYRSNGLMNPYSVYGSPYSNQSWRNPYATQAPKLYEGNSYRGRWSANRFDHDSTSNPFGRYGSPYSPESIRNPFGAGNPYNPRPIYVYPGK